jgi:succinate dehydrogenase/fumarate reductase flavoprotein subunit
MKEKESLSRRSFLTGGTVLAVAATVGGLIGCSSENPAANIAKDQPWLPERWDYEADFVIVGYGGAGASAAITAAHENLGSAIVIEAAPEGEEGGNSGVCGQILMIPDNAGAAVEYQSNCNGKYVVEKELMQAWAEALCENLEWFSDLGIELKEMQVFNPEFPEVPGGLEGGGTTYCVDGIFGQRSCWSALKEQEDYFDMNIMYATRGLKVVRNPITNEALGIEADQSGTTIFLKANKGVILSCGGHEFDQEALNTYRSIGISYGANVGTPYNRGDGLRMIAPFGAKLRHMNNSTVGSWCHRIVAPDNYQGISASYKAPDFIFVGPNSKRFVNENMYTLDRHGKMIINGIFQELPVPDNSWTVGGNACFEAGPFFGRTTMAWAYVFDQVVGEENQDFVDAGLIVRADTIEELAEKMGHDTEALRESIERYNSYCAAGHDPDFHRGEPIYDTVGAAMATADQLEASAATGESHDADSPAINAYAITPIEPPYFAMRGYNLMGNTQGGPKRSAHNEVMTVFDEVVPRLYATGEFGTVYAYQYNGGGNLSDAIASGRVAVRHAATLDSWDASSSES